MRLSKLFKRTHLGLAHLLLRKPYLKTEPALTSSTGKRAKGLGVSASRRAAWGSQVTDAARGDEAGRERRQLENLEVAAQMLSNLSACL